MRTPLRPTPGISAAFMHRLASSRTTNVFARVLCASHREIPQLAGLPKSASLTAPQANWTCAAGGPTFFAYWTCCLIDVKHGVTVGVRATPANHRDKVESTNRTIRRVETNFAPKP